VVGHLEDAGAGACLLLLQEIVGTDAEQMIDIALNAKSKTIVEGYSALPAIFVVLK
jgi:hypothetical protein